MLAPSPWAAAADHFDHRYRRDPVTWAHDRLDTFLWSKQRAVLESVRDHRYTAVPSCHDVGKSFAAGTIAAWWLENHPPGEAFVVSTAPSFAQVRAILWREIGRAHRKGKLRGRINQTEWWIDDEIVGYGRKPSDTDPAAFQGIHARYVLVIIDEACGVPKTIFDAVDSLVTNEYSRVLAIGNPDDPASHFADICKPASGWNVIHIDGYDSPNFTGETIPDQLGPLLLSPVWVEERKDRWGETSPLFIAKVRGRFPEESDDGVVQLSMLSRCRVPKDWAPGQLEPVELGVDVGAGGDFTSIRERHGAKVGRVWRTHSRRPEEVHDVVLAAIIESGATAVKVDAIGIGWMLVGWLNRDRTEGLHGATIHGVNVGEGAYDPTRFVNLRDQIWWEIGRELAQDGAVDLADAEDADDLVAQLIAPHYGIGTGGRIKVEKKAETRKRIGRSPDDADAYLLALFTPKVEVDTIVTAEDLDPSIDDGGISPY